MTKASGKAGGKRGRAAPSDGPVNVLLAEDEESFIEALVIGLTNEGFRVTVARDGVEALQLYEETGPDILLLDLMLPKLSGIDVCRTIRTRSQIPIIMVTAKAEESDELVGFATGADDYVTKPYSMKVLVQRIKKELRRIQLQDEAPSGAVIESQGVIIDRHSHKALYRETELPLTPTEFRLLEVLVRQAGRAFTRYELMDAAIGEDAIVLERTIDVHIKRLRSRIEADPSTPVLITTVRGVGYRFAAAAGTPTA